MNKLKNLKPNPLPYPLPTLYKYMYLTDAQFIIGSIQNLLVGMNLDFIDYFKRLSLVGNITSSKKGVFVVSGPAADSVASVLGSYFIKAHSILDLITKIAYELESSNYNFEKYSNLKCAKILYSDRKKLSVNNSKETLFIRDNIIGQIESIRDEVIHNGSWELRPKVFCKIRNGYIIERYMYYPDMTDGHYSKYVNRYHFFSSGNKVNDVLPNIHFKFLNRLLKTILRICNPTATYEQLLAMC